MNKKIGLIVVSIVGLLVLAGAGYYVSKGKQPGEGMKAVVPSEFGGDIDVGEGFDVGEIGKATENPLKNMPSINPLEDVANPFRDAYKNPFK